MAGEGAPHTLLGSGISALVHILQRPCVPRPSRAEAARGQVLDLLPRVAPALQAEIQIRTDHPHSMSPMRPRQRSRLAWTRALDDRASTSGIHSANSAFPPAVSCVQQVASISRGEF